MFYQTPMLQMSFSPFKSNWALRISKTWNCSQFRNDCIALYWLQATILSLVRTGLVRTGGVCSGAVYLPRLPLQCRLEIMMMLFPVKDVSGRLEKSSCSRYELDLVQNLSALGNTPGLDHIQNLTALGSSPDVLLSSLKQEGCKDGWTYSTEHYQSTVVTEVLNYCCFFWNLLLIYYVCLFVCFLHVFTIFNISNLTFTAHFM